MLSRSRSRGHFISSKFGPVVTNQGELGISKAAVCRTFGLKRTTLIDFLAGIGWSAASGIRGRHE
jgi:hypothetical protein